MKVRLLTLLAAIFLLSNVSYAQGVGAYNAKKTEKVKVKKNNLIPQRKGFYVMPEANIGIHSVYAYNSNEIVGNYSSHLNLICKLGYEYNNHFALGIGTGVNINYDIYGISMPIFLNLHGDLLKRNISKSKVEITPYYSINIGYLFNVNKNIGDERIAFYDDVYCGNHYDGDYIVGNETYFYYYKKGFMLSPEIGLRFNNSYLGIVFLISTSHEDYENYHYHNNLLFEHSYEESFNSNRSITISLKFGYKIPLKKK